MNRRVVEKAGGAPVHSPKASRDSSVSPLGRLPLVGTGLGLTLTKKMVEIVGGSIRVDSQLGHGSTFTVWLPGVVASPDSRQLAASAAV